jgi:hypothetical protein
MLWWLYKLNENMRFFLQETEMPTNLRVAIVLLQVAVDAVYALVIAAVAKNKFSYSFS